VDIVTADLCDAHPGVHVLEPIFRSYGGRTAFGGPVATVRVHEDNSLVKEVLAEPGRGRILVVDGGGSLRCALMGDRVAAGAVGQSWAGVVIYGCIRDSAEVAEMDLGVRALATHPRKSRKRGEGQRDVTVTFGGVVFRPGAWLYADADGVLVSGEPLL